MYMLLPGAVLYAIMKPGQKTEAELRADLEAKYSHNIRKNVGQREAMQKRDARAAATRLDVQHLSRRYFDNMKHGGDAEQDKKMAAMLHNGGKHVVKPTYDERFRPDK
jgi:hypothetical protein|tara:strand:+ start:124 stop:447 length:324 start_codon:yes stop_codon:yes gene_type:complete